MQRLLTSLFLNVPGGTLYLSVYAPDLSASPRGWIIHVPAFAEEMNKARPMVNHQARQMAAQGYCVVVPDLSGTGDSSGEFEQASWQRWQHDIAGIIRWVAEQGAQTLTLWGLRLGCLLALEVARAQPEQVSRLILWQPVLLGEPFMTRFLRLRLAASLGDSKNNSPTALRSELSSGACVEVAGYLLSPALVREVDAMDAAALLIPSTGVEVLWAEVGTGEQPSVGVGSRTVLDTWSTAGFRAESVAVKGEPFWATQEIAWAPDLLEETTRYLQSAKPDGAQTPHPLESLTHTCQDYCVEQPLTFECEADELVGILHHAPAEADTAILVVVGGPQYRVGSHRQFLIMARQFARAGVPVLRFDYRGMGDSAGVYRGYLNISSDICSAVDALQREVPAVRKVVLLGLCDAATAGAFYAPSDERIAGLVLINPWVRSEQGQARAYLRHYYLARLLERSFWKKLAGGQFSFSHALRSLKINLSNALKQTQSLDKKEEAKLEDALPGQSKSSIPEDNLVSGMFHALAAYPHRVLLALSGKDLTAAEFRDAVNADARFRRLLGEERFERYELPQADHTFSSRASLDQLTGRILEWVKAL